MIIVENSNPEIKLEELEQKNQEELESLGRLIILFEDIKNIKNSNLEYAKEILKEVKFQEFLIIGKLGNLIKEFFQSYYEIKLKKIENLKEIINVMKSKFFDKQKYEINNLINRSRNISDLSEPKYNGRYIGKEDILEIIDSIPLINEFNNEYNDNYLKIIGKEINNLKEMKNINDLNLLKEIKEQKIIFDNRLKDISDNGIESNDLNIVRNLLLNDNSDEQKYIIWCANYLNNFRAKLSIVDEKVYNAFIILFDLMFDKLNEKKLYQTLDLAIILIQTISKKKDMECILLEEEFKDNKIFKNADIWTNLIIQKTKDLFDKINEEGKDDKEKKENMETVEYIKGNIEPILVSYIFTMKDFNIDDETKRKVIEDICKMKEYEKFHFNFDELISYLS